MRGKQYANSKPVRLADYIRAEDFRTVMAKDACMPHGRNEVCVRIELILGGEAAPEPEDPGKERLLGGREIGFVKDNVNIREIFSGEMAEEYEDRRITLYEWMDKFLMIFENGSGTAERSFFVSTAEVKHLLANCRRGRLI